MSTSGEWTVEGRCPHGYTARLPFDALGYLMVPKDSSCDEHRDRQAKRDAAKAAYAAETAAYRRPGWFTLWRETRKARKALREGPPWLSK